VGKDTGTGSVSPPPLLPRGTPVPGRLEEMTHAF